jgi:hypothetical protein
MACAFSSPIKLVSTENDQIWSLAAIAFHDEFDGALTAKSIFSWRILLLAFSASIHWMFAEFNIWLLSAPSKPTGCFTLTL